MSDPEELENQLADAMNDLHRTEAALRTAVEALGFYADPESYFAVAIAGDPPCGDFAYDFDEQHSRPDMGPRHGKLARETLRSLINDIRRLYPEEEGDR